MTVAELIAKLQKMPQDAEVLRWRDPGCDPECYADVSNVEVQEPLSWKGPLPVVIS